MKFIRSPYPPASGFTRLPAIGLVRDLEDQLQTVCAQFKKLMDEDLPAYNRVAAARGWKPLAAANAK